MVGLSHVANEHLRGNGYAYRSNVDPRPALHRPLRSESGPLSCALACPLSVKSGHSAMQNKATRFSAKQVFIRSTGRFKYEHRAHGVLLAYHGDISGIKPGNARYFREQVGVSHQKP